MTSLSTHALCLRLNRTKITFYFIVGLLLDLAVVLHLLLLVRQLRLQGGYSKFKLCLVH